MAWRRRTVGALAVSCLVALGGCGSSDDKAGGGHVAAKAATTAAPAQSDVQAQATVRTASCKDWNDAGAGERERLVAQIGAFEGAKVSGAPGTYGSSIPDSEAEIILTKQCAPTYAKAFKLYKIYSRAAGFGAG